MILMFQRNKGMSLTTLLFSLALFSVLFIAFNQWTASQRKSAVKTYQDFQAIQIAENQAQRQFLGLPCEQLIQQNSLTFRVQCENERVIVRYPMGEISIKTK
ncbi:type II secretion system protein [Haemophilus haemolyticus]|uniref:Type II secretion system protein n=2 Tax=Haemophilus haemolyticus TaxID=726 RepID=A0ABY2YMW5_HAEHA|nr:type II secretion system protein [Haemophilus haemolyticus]